MKHLLKDEYLNLESIAEANKNKYINAKPFPHIYFDNFFNDQVLNNILSDWPNTKDNKKFFNEDGKNEKKISTTSPLALDVIPSLNEFLSFLNSYRFVNFVQNITGIEESLVPDPYFIGGGVHEIKRGGFLKVHADFNYHPKFKLSRRINALIYLNKDWEENYGGHLELWDRKMQNCEIKILPVFNRMVIFNTTYFSYHGHPNPLNCPESKSRKSLALYYYSNGRPKEEMHKDFDNQFRTTLWKNRKDIQGEVSNSMPIYKKIFGKLYYKTKIKN